MIWNHIKIQSIDKGKHSKPAAYRTDPKLHQELFTTHSPFVDKIKEKKIYISTKRIWRCAEISLSLLLYLFCHPLPTLFSLFVRSLD